MKTWKAILITLLVGILVAGCGKRTRPPVVTALEQIQITERASVGIEQIAIFECYEEDCQQQENINNWLAGTNGKVEITRVLQSQSGRGGYRYLIITIFYIRK